MAAIRIRKKIESEKLDLPELKPLIGKTVEITVEEAAPEIVHTRAELDERKKLRQEIDRLAEENARIYGVHDAGVEIIREMRDNRHFQGDS